MWGEIKSLLTVNGSQWFETLPFYCGAALLLIEFAVRCGRGRHSVLNPIPLVYAFGEGISLATVATYGPALIFNKALAMQIADKNAKIIVIALLFAFISILHHLITNWFSPADPHAGS